MLKLAGGLAVLFSGVLAAHLSVRRERESVALLDAWIALLYYLRGQIDCFMTPLDEILRGADPVLLERIAPGGESETLDGLLAACGERIAPEALRLLRALLSELGSTYREEQIKRFDYYLSELDRVRRGLAEALPGRVRMTRTLYVCAAGALTLLLW